MSFALAPQLGIVLIVAMAENGVIGDNNTIPWRLKSDQQRFRQITWGKPIVMGRKTFVSLRRPLPGRTNIVITRDSGFRAAGAVVTGTLEDALSIAAGDALRRAAAEIAVIGGGQIYAQSMLFADRLDVTEVHARPDGDARFGPIDPSIWEETARERHSASAEDSADFSYVSYRRRADR